MHHTRRLYVVALLLVLTACAAHRPPFQVFVRDAADRLPLEDATVTVWVEGKEDASLSARTGQDGLAAFPAPPQGTVYKVRVAHADYAQAEAYGAGAPLDVPLLPVLKEVVRVMGTMDIASLTQDSSVPGRFYQNVLTLAPGVDDSVSARERDFKAMVSGVSNQDPPTGGFAALVNPDSIEEVRVVTSGAGVDHGGAQGGFANIVQAQGDAPDEGPPTEASFGTVVENGFALAEENATSTFAVDVDRASYALVRRYLLEWKQRPPRNAVRLEEMVNYFPYAYPDPPGKGAMAVHVDDAPSPWAPAHRLVRIGLQARRQEAKKLPQSTLVFLVDVSGSMDTPDRLPLVQSALAALTEELRPEDRVALVTYADGAQVVLPATPGDQKARILDALDALEPGGGTAGASGLTLAYQVAAASQRRHDNTRVILATDGDFNVGPTSDDALLALIKSHRARKIALSVLGVGSGEDLDDRRMEIIADHGDGNYSYADTPLEARRALVEEMGGTLATVARDVKVQVTFNPAHVRSWRLLGYENRALAREDFEDDAKDAGEMGAGHTVTAFYEVEPVETAATEETAPEWLSVEVRWQPPHGGPSELVQVPAVLGKDTTSADFRFASAVAEFALVLRDSPHKGGASLESAMERARETVGKDADGRRSELVALMEAYEKAPGP